MIKLIKYEVKGTWKLVCATMVLYLAMTTALKLSVSVMSDVNDWEDFCSVVLLLAFVTAVVVLYGYFINRFRVTVFGKEGYITNTLPVKKRQIIVAKWLVAVIWSVTAMGIMLLAIYALFLPYNIGELIHEGFFADKHTTIYATFSVVKMFASIVGFYITIFAVMAVGHSFTSHKILISVGVYFGYTYVRNFIDIVMSLLTTLIFSYTAYEGGEIILATYLVSDLICIVAAYFVTQYFIKNKLSLE